MSQILYSKPVIDKALEELKQKTNELITSGITPCLKVILVGDHPPSVIYTRNKKKFCESFGAQCEIIKLDKNISAEDFKIEVDKITNDENTHGCFVQLPLPAQLKKVRVDELIPPQKDVDGFHAVNVGKIYQGFDERDFLAPCTPKGIMTLLRHYNIDINGKNVTVIGRSQIVGRPMSLMITNHNGTATLCHSKTKDLQSICKNSDIIISAVGKTRFLNSEYIGPNKPIVIDVGMNIDSEKKLCGDADFENIKNQCSAITPVPGGVGPLTILSLAQNLILATKK